MALVALALVSGCDDDGPVRTVPSASCIRFDDYIRFLSTVDTPGSTRRAARKGDVVYAADGVSGV